MRGSRLDGDDPLDPPPDDEAFQIAGRQEAISSAAGLEAGLGPVGLDQGLAAALDVVLFDRFQQRLRHLRRAEGAPSATVRLGVQERLAR